MACCPVNSWGKLDESYDLKGKEITLNDGKLTCYLTEPADEGTDKAVLVLNDVFGPDSGRTKGICDDFASRGYVTIMPYLLEDDPIPTVAWGTKAGFLDLLRMVKWLHGHKWGSKVGPMLLDHTIPYLKERGIKKIALACFCWGAYPMTHLLAEQDPSIVCGVGYHPSLQVFTGLFDFNRSKYLKKFKVPIMFLSAKSDPGDIKPGGLADQEMKKLAVCDECVFKEYDDMIHGWVNRGPFSDEKIKRDYDDAIKISNEFITKHMEK